MDASQGVSTWIGGSRHRWWDGGLYVGFEVLKRMMMKVLVVGDVDDDDVDCGGNATDDDLSLDFG